MIDFRLKVFCSVANNLSFTKAAQELFISQPAISKHIQELEEYYQVRLFDRMGSKIKLTDAGKQLLRNSNNILNQYNRMEYEMHLLQNENAGNLKIGASTTIAQYVLPPLLATFTERFPKVNLSMLNGNSREIEQAVLEHRIDLGMVEGNLHQSSLKYSHFMDDELVAVVFCGSKLAKIDEVTLEELMNIPIVLRERGSGTLDVLENVLKEHDVRISQMQVKMYLGSTESIKLFLEHSDCMGIVSIRSISRDLYAGKFKVIDIKDITIKREFSLVQPFGGTDALVELFQQYLYHYNETL